MNAPCDKVARVSESRRARSTPSREQTADFYDRLLQGEESRGWWGAENRFDADKIVASRSVARYFRDTLRPFLGPEARVLDVGCGPGGFLAVLAGIAGHVVGLDIAEEFVAAARETIGRHDLGNARVEHGSSESLPFDEGAFDAVVMVDVIHHLERIEPTLDEARRVLAPGGRLLVFEPNKLNPLLWAMCAIDRNEWGLLRLGTQARYRRLLDSRFAIERMEYSGLLIGPDGPAFMRIADWLLGEPAARLLGWLSPKIFIAAGRD